MGAPSLSEQMQIMLEQARNGTYGNVGEQVAVASEQNAADREQAFKSAAAIDEVAQQYANSPAFNRARTNLDQIKANTARQQRYDNVDTDLGIKLATLEDNRAAAEAEAKEKAVKDEENYAKNLRSIYDWKKANGMDTSQEEAELAKYGYKISLDSGELTADKIPFAKQALSTIDSLLKSDQYKIIAGRSTPDFISRAMGSRGKTDIMADYDGLLATLGFLNPELAKTFGSNDTDFKRAIASIYGLPTPDLLEKNKLQGGLSNEELATKLNRARGIVAARLSPEQLEADEEITDENVDSNIESMW